MVLHSDKETEKWNSIRNGWGKHIVRQAMVSPETDGDEFFEDKLNKEEGDLQDEEDSQEINEEVNDRD